MKTGFGSPNFDKARQKEIARLGGRMAHLKHTAHEWTREEAQAAGRLGGRRSQEARALKTIAY